MVLFETDDDSGQRQYVTVSGQRQYVTVSGQRQYVTVSGQRQYVTVSGQRQYVTVSGNVSSSTTFENGQVWRHGSSSTPPTTVADEGWSMSRLPWSHPYERPGRSVSE